MICKEPRPKVTPLSKTSLPFESHGNDCRRKVVISGYNISEEQ